MISTIGLKSLEVADLEDASVLFGGADQPISGLEIRCDRLFDKQVDSGVEELDADLGMVLCGNSDDGCLDTAREFGGVPESLAIVFAGDGSGAVEIVVDDGDEMGGGQVAQHAGVLLSKRADTYDGDSGWVGGGALLHARAVSFSRSSKAWPAFLARW